MARTTAAIAAPRTSGSPRPLERNGVRIWRAEQLAAGVEMDERGHALKPVHSLLRSNLGEELECSTRPYDRWLVWGACMLLAAWMAARTWVWRLFYAAYCALFDKAEFRQIRRSKSVRFLMGPQKGSFLFDRIHPLNREVREGVTTSKALDAIYSAPLLLVKPARKNLFSLLAHSLAVFWFNQPEAQAVRNRLRIVYREILADLRAKWDGGQREFLLASLACGSAQAMVEAVSVFLEEHPSAKVMIHLVDLNESSLRRALRLAEARGIEESVVFFTAGIRDFLEDVEEEYDVIEMVGFLDYRSPETVVSLTAAVRRVLKVNGLHLSAHILPHRWSFITRWVHNWPLLIRRSVETFKGFMLDSGFQKNETKLTVEPQRGYVVAICRKHAK